jgi:hypothetical protein
MKHDLAEPNGDKDGNGIRMMEASGKVFNLHLYLNFRSRRGSAGPSSVDVVLCKLERKQRQVPAYSRPILLSSPFLLVGDPSRPLPPELRDSELEYSRNTI